ncbi:unnamed protein product [Ceratitis capitata]|uniref:(Mediterranean fruit fly) hypothetical protein n=1 Tax=Ceratitis capitata TaxID=7213 RepID=A0A811V2Q2_CERCA|nr:unnamed protein product [Ceratitis capitata]
MCAPHMRQQPKTAYRRKQQLELNNGGVAMHTSLSHSCVKNTMIYVCMYVYVCAHVLKLVVGCIMLASLDSLSAPVPSADGDCLDYSWALHLFICLFVMFFLLIVSFFIFCFTEHSNTNTS